MVADWRGRGMKEKYAFLGREEHISVGKADGWFRANWWTSYALCRSWFAVLKEEIMLGD